MAGQIEDRATARGGRVAVGLGGGEWARLGFVRRRGGSTTS